MKRVHSRKGNYDIYCGRPGPFGNPFIIGKDGNRKEVIQKFADWWALQTNLKNDFLMVVHEFNMENRHLPVLGCWCDDDEACHCDVLILTVEEAGFEDPVKE